MRGGAALQEGRLRRAAFKDGAFCASLVFGLLRPHSTGVDDAVDRGAVVTTAADGGGGGGGG